MRLSAKSTYALLVGAFAILAVGALVAGNLASDRMTASASKPPSVMAGVGEVKVAQADTTQFQKANEVLKEQLRIERKKNDDDRVEFKKRIQDFERQISDLIAQGRVLAREKMRLEIDLDAARKTHPQPKVVPTGDARLKQAHDKLEKAEDRFERCEAQLASMKSKCGSYAELKALRERCRNCPQQLIK